MSTFDGWETQFYGDCLSYGQDSLMHFRTKGSKNGVRRYQNPDGTWTDLGLKERRAREGFGERRAARKAERLRRREERRAARSERIAKFKEAQRKKNVKNLTDKELEAKIKRLKMEQEYKELNKSPLLEVGKKIVDTYLGYKTKKMENKIRKEELYLQNKKLDVDRKNTRDRAKADTERAKADAERAKADALEVKKGNKAAANKAKLIGAKLAYRNTTIRGGIGKFFNKKFEGAGEKSKETQIEKAKDKSEQRKVKTIIKNNKRIDRYNRSIPLGQQKASHVKTDDERTAEKYAYEIEKARIEAKKAKYGSKGKS